MRRKEEIMMRSREEIMKKVEPKTDAPYLLHQAAAFVEVLIDIRDELIEIKFALEDAALQYRQGH